MSIEGIGGLTSALGGGATYMTPGDYETAAGLVLEPVGTAPGAPLEVDAGFDLPVSPFESPDATLTFDPVAPELPAFAPGTFVNIAIGIAIGIVIDRVFLR